MGPGLEADDAALIPIAGNGLLPRRAFLTSGLSSVGLGAAGLAFMPITQAQNRAGWMQAPGQPLSGYGQPSVYEGHVQRERVSAQPGTLGSGASRTPLQDLKGTITPAGLHFERHHSGVPVINPDAHFLTIQGQVRNALRFSVHDLMRYPMISKICALECSGNSAANLADAPPDLSCGAIHGLVSASEWTGISLASLLEEAGVDAKAQWVIAEGADAARMNRSIPLAKVMDDAMLALYQNGERIRPEQGYPLRLLLPGYEGNTSIKWLHRLEVSTQPAMSRQETSKYTDLRADGRSEVFTLEMGVKSVITAPSGGQQLQGPGYYEITGLAWSGRGAIESVEVSADGGRSWAPAAFASPVQSQALTQFRIPWRWDGSPCVLLSRARDSHAQQPTRAAWLQAHGPHAFYHYNAMQAWQVDSAGQIRNVYS